MVHPLATWAYIDPSDFELRASRWKTVSSFFLLASLLIALTNLLASPLTDVSSILRLFLTSGPPAVLGVVSFNRKVTFERRSSSAKLLNHFRTALASEKKYILLLRSFTSRLLTETTYRLRGEEREEMRTFRGERFPTGRKYVEYVREDQRVDHVLSFLLEAVQGTHIVVIDGKESSMSIEILCVLSSDAEWRHVFEELKEGAQLIAIVPESSPSLTEEIVRVAGTTSLGKCVFLMPPSTGLSSARSGMTRRSGWEESRKKLPIRLPGYTEDGALLTFAAIDDPPNVLSYDRASLEQILANHSEDGVSLGQALATLQDKKLLPKTLTVLRRELESVVS